MSRKQNTIHECQYTNSRGQRCHMLIDENHRPTNGAKRSTLCAYHSNRISVIAPPVEPEVLAADLLGDIDDFSTAASVNLFLGNLVKLLALKRIARRDAVALAYISQLLLNTIPVLERQQATDYEARRKADHEQFVRNLLDRTRQVSAALRDQPSPESSAPSSPDPVVAGL
jgi:hypothetical protein